MTFRPTTFGFGPDPLILRALGSHTTWMDDSPEDAAPAAFSLVLPLATVVLRGCSSDPYIPLDDRIPLIEKIHV